MIDLGLPSGTKWVFCNVGASKPEDYGGYYAWGETEEKSVYNWETYSHCDGSSSTCHNIGSDISTTQYDAARANWHSLWRMPTIKELDELNTECSWNWTQFNGISGYKVIAPNGNYIFLPAAGYRNNSESVRKGAHGYYYSSTLFTSRSDYAYDRRFEAGNPCSNSDMAVVILDKVFER